MDFKRMKNKSDIFYSQALFVLGWIIIGLGTIGSIGLAISAYDYKGTILFVGLLSTAISGFLILGLAEIINILNDNRRLLATMTQNNEIIGGESSVAKSIADELPEL